MTLTTYDDFKANQTIIYGSPATSDSANKGPLFIKKELNDLLNYINIRFGQAPLPWIPTTQYFVGDYCERSGIIYKALFDNINNEPNSSNWEVIDILPQYRALYIWDDVTNYSTWDVVIHEDIIYEANNANLNDEPNSSSWTEIMFLTNYNNTNTTDFSLIYYAS